MTFEKDFVLPESTQQFLQAKKEAPDNSFFGYSNVYTFLAGDKSRTGILRKNFNPKSRRVLSMQKCKEQVVPAKWNEIHFLGTFSFLAIQPNSGVPGANYFQMEVLDPRMFDNHQFIQAAASQATEKL